jgi:hypothetical protein
MFNSGGHILCLLKAVILLLKQYNKKHTFVMKCLNQWNDVGPPLNLDVKLTSNLWSTTNKLQRFLDLFISINSSTCFRWFLCPSSGAQNYIECQVLSNQYCCLLLSWMVRNYVLCSWWWVEELPETCRAIYRNK